MKKILVILSILPFITMAQITVSKSDGGPNTTKLSGSIALNDKSTLKRDWILLNDGLCPIQLIGVGINTNYQDRRYSFKPAGGIAVTEQIMAYEVHHVLYNIFGEHIKTLSNQEVEDISQATDFNKYSSWYASENQVSEYLFCVSYVASVRTQKGTIWQYNPQEIKSELSKIKINYEASYVPPIKDNN